MSASATKSRLSSVVRLARGEGRDVLLEHEGLAVARAMGLATPHHLVAEDVGALDSLELDEFPGERVVIKALCPELLHKTDVGAVAVVPRNAAAIREAARGMVARLAPRRPPDGFLVEAHVPHRADIGGELLLSLRWTREFGPVVTLGLGGTAVEFLAAALPPGQGTANFSRAVDGPEAVAGGLAGRSVTTLATGAVRGVEGRTTESGLREVVEGALAFADSFLPEPFVEVEINPLVFTEEGPTALDAVVRLAPSDGRPPTGRPSPPAGSVDALLHPGSVAVVGVSERMNPGRVTLTNLLAQGFPAERVTVIKEGVESVEGCRCVPDLASLPDSVDLLVVAVGAGQVPDLMDDVVESHRARSVILIPGGLGEKSGTEGRAARLAETVRSPRSNGRPRVVVNGGNCLGVRSVPGRLNTLFIPDRKLPFPDRAPDPLAVISQSGAFAIARMSHLPGLNPRYVVTVGNQIDLTVGDYLDHLEGDPDTRVFACYVEGFQPLDGDRFLRAASRITRSGRAVVLYRAGRTRAGARATASHTASIAGDYAVTRDLAGQAGVLVAETVQEFHELVALALALDDRPLDGARVGAVSNAGFECVTLADSLGPLSLADLGAETRSRLSGILEAHRLADIVGVGNPLDVTPVLDDGGFADALEAMLDDPGVDLGVAGCVPLTPALQTLPPGDSGEDLTAPDGLAARLVDLWSRTEKPWVVAVDGGPLYDPLAAALAGGGIPVFRSADRAVGLLGRYAEWRACARAGGKPRTGDFHDRP